MLFGISISVGARLTPPANFVIDQPGQALDSCGQSILFTELCWRDFEVLFERTVKRGDIGVPKQMRDFGDRQRSV